MGVLEGGQLRRLTDFSAPLRTVAGISEPQELTLPSADGYPVHGWLVKPAGPGPHPVLLNIHGGPFAQFSVALFDEAQVYAGAGYAVLMCNPRGSAGYGQSHGRSIKERMGTVDMQDVLAFLDGAVEKFDDLDAENVGIMGGSYGGYLTAWTISHDHRFRAAIVERGFLDPVSFTGSSDIGWFFGGEYTGPAAEQMAAQSPMARVDNVRTPSLVIHSEEDLRCPVEQGQRYFTALKQQGVETGFLVFPGENHELSRSGTPHHRKQRFDEILKWWARYLPTDGNPAPRAVVFRRVRQEPQFLPGAADVRLRPAGSVFGIAAEGAQFGPVEVQDPVHVVGLMLDNPGLPAGEVPFELRAVRRRVVEPDRLGPQHRGLQAVQWRGSLRRTPRWPCRGAGSAGSAWRRTAAAPARGRQLPRGRPRTGPRGRRAASGIPSCGAARPTPGALCITLRIRSMR